MCRAYVEDVRERQRIGAVELTERELGAELVEEEAQTDEDAFDYLARLALFRQLVNVEIRESLDLFLLKIFGKHARQ